MADVFKASYTGPASAGQSAGRLARYIANRQTGERLRDGRDRYEALEVMGDAARFKEAAKARAEERTWSPTKGEMVPRRSIYTHVILSPEHGDQLEDEDLRRLVEPWVTNHNGEELPFIAAVHRDTEHPHVHIAAVRDKYTARDLAERKERTRELIAERERVRGIDRAEIERQREAEREEQAEREHDRGETPEAEQEQERSRGRSRG